MKLILKGITKSETISELSTSQFNQFSFDMRPKSFNFTQGRNVASIIDKYRGLYNFSILFENEKSFMVKEILKPFTDRSNVVAEFSGRTPLSELNDLEVPFFWHYHDEEKISNLKNMENLKRIIFHQSDLEYLNQRGELFGFFQLFSDFFEKIEFEIQLEWNSEIIVSLLDSFNLLILSFEINSSVEKAYQTPNTELINQYIKQTKVFLNKGN